MDRKETLDRICREFGLLAVYLFGSRKDDGLRILKGEEVSKEGSDLDVGVVFTDPEEASFRRLALLQGAMEDLFRPLRVDLVSLHRVDSIFQANAIDGHRIAAPDSRPADLYELLVMRKAAELLPLQRRIEEEVFGFSTS